MIDTNQIKINFIYKSNTMGLCIKFNPKKDKFVSFYFLK